MKRPESDKAEEAHPFGLAATRGNADTQDARLPAGRDPLELDSRWMVADRYEILGLLGTGGMGTVYRARDRELDEHVALKMLKKQIAAAPGILERFRREVKLARRVTHRNVARTFDIGEHAGAKFLTMEFIDGEMLGALLARRGRLRLTEVVRIGQDVCAGLAAAHAAGVLHRDLKPANVIIARDGRAVITDFGIARALTQGESTRSVGGVVGTPAYMAPEQLDGTADLDARVDVYALGAMLFELLAGEVPWAGATPIRAALARLQEPPPDLRAARPSLPPAAAALVAKCMARLRDDRFASAEELGAALEVLVTPEETSPSLYPSLQSSHPRPLAGFVRTTLAVLAIVNEGERAQDYLADSLTEDLSDVLDAVPEILVRPRQYATHAPDGSTDPLAVGRACGVDAVVAGTLRSDGDRVEVSLRLQTVEDGFQLWEGRFESSAAAMVAIADAAAAAIAAALTTKAMSPPRSLPVNPAAHVLYLRGRYLFLRGWYDGQGEAIRLLATAHELVPSDPRIAATYARALARGYGIASLGEETARSAKDMAEKALAIEPRSADARLALAMVHLYRGEGVGAAAEIRRALAIAPGDPDVLEMLGRLRVEIGPLEAGIENLESVLEREPLHAEARYTKARAWALLGDRARAEASLGPRPKDMAARVPHLLTSARLAMWWADASLAPELMRAMEDLGPRVKKMGCLIAGVAARQSLSADERASLEKMFPSGSATAQRLASFNGQIRAEAYLTCGETELGIAAIGDADANGLLDLTWLDRCSVLDGVRGRPELEAIRRSTALRAARVNDILNLGP